MHLRYLPRWVARRRAIANQYCRSLADVTGIGLPLDRPRSEGAYHLFVVTVEDRDRVRQDLLALGVETAVHYPTPIHRTQAFAEFRTHDCPIAEEYAERILSLPMYPELERSQLEYVASLLSDFMQA